MRRLLRSFLSLAGLAFWIGSSPGPAAAERLILRTPVDGVTRTAIVDVGRDAKTTPSPLLFVFHGATLTGSFMTGLGFAAAWPEATIVYPNGRSRPNSALGMTATGWQNLPGENDDEDVRFVGALLQQLSATYQVDQRRVYATGLSNGAGFSYLLLTLRPGQFAAVAPVAAACPPTVKWASTPRPVLITHGRTDPVDISWAEWARNQLQRLNGCGAEATEWARGTVSLGPCATGRPVLWSTHSGGHTWPAGATANVVRFLKEQSLPATPAPPPAAESQAFDSSHAVVGTGRAGFAGEGAAANGAQLNFPESIALDSSGNLYIADTGNNRVRRVDGEGKITTSAGQAASSLLRAQDREGIAARSAHLFWPESIIVDRQGQVIIADTLNRKVRRVNLDGKVITVAGRGPRMSSIRFSGDNGPANRAELSFPTGLAVDSQDNLYIADCENHRVRRVDAEGNIRTVAGTGTAGLSLAPGKATETPLQAPWGLALDREGNLYIADSANHQVRKLALDGTISTVAGTGSPGFSGDEGLATSAQLHQPLGLAVDSQGNLFIADSRNFRVRRVSPEGVITTVFSGEAGQEGEPPAARYHPSGLAIDASGNLLIADPFHHRIWRVTGVAAPGLIAGQPFP